MMNPGFVSLVAPFGLIILAIVALDAKERWILFSSVSGILGVAVALIWADIWCIAQDYTLWVMTWNGTAAIVFLALYNILYAGEENKQESKTR